MDEALSTSSDSLETLKKPIRVKTINVSWRNNRICRE